MMPHRVHRIRAGAPANTCVMPVTSGTRKCSLRPPAADGGSRRPPRRRKDRKSDALRPVLIGSSGRMAPNRRRFGNDRSRRHSRHSHCEREIGFKSGSPICLVVPTTPRRKSDIRWTGLSTKRCRNTRLAGAPTVGFSGEGATGVLLVDSSGFGA